MKYCPMFHQQCGTYGTGLVTVSLKATLGFPITHWQLYSLSILYNTNQNLFVDFSPQQDKYYSFLNPNNPRMTKSDLLAWTAVPFARMTVNDYCIIADVDALSSEAQMEVRYLFGY